LTLQLVPPGTDTGNWIVELCIPDDLYLITRTPVPLAGMSYPGRADWPRLHDSFGIGHVVCLTADEPPLDYTPCTVTAIRLQDLVSGNSPREPNAEAARAARAADDVVEHLARGIGVAVHCMGGRGRTGTVIGIALVRLGNDADDVVDYLHRSAVGRGRRGWPESPWQADLVRAQR